MQRIKDHKVFLSKLVNADTESERKQVLKEASDDEIVCLIEVILNINLLLDNDEQASFQKEIAEVEKVVKPKRLALTVIRKLLLQALPVLITILTYSLSSLFKLAE